MTVFHALACGIHESTRGPGPCWRCEVAADELRAESRSRIDPSPDSIEPSTEVPAAVLHAEYREQLRHDRNEPAWARPKLLHPKRSIPTTTRRGTPELHRTVVARALGGEAVGSLAKETGFSRASIYAWLAKARSAKEAA